MDLEVTLAVIILTILFFCGGCASDLERHTKARNAHIYCGPCGTDHREECRQQCLMELDNK